MSRRGRKKILVVEDDADVRIYLSSLLGNGGIEIIEAVDGDDGIRKAKDLEPDLIILDVMIAGKGGILMYRRLKRNPETWHIPVIMLSGIEKETFFRYKLAEYILPGTCMPDPEAYLEKPPEADELLRQVRRLTRSSPEIPE